MLEIYIEPRRGIYTELHYQPAPDAILASIPARDGEYETPISKQLILEMTPSETTPYVRRIALSCEEFVNYQRTQGRNGARRRLIVLNKNTNIGTTSLSHTHQLTIVYQP